MRYKSAISNSVQVFFQTKTLNNNNLGQEHFRELTNAF